MAATNFPRFPKLPAEIRIEIWRLHAQHDGRLVELRFSKQRQPNGRLEFQWTSKTKPPILLVNQESRFEGLKFYQRSFAHQTPSGEIIPAVVLFNPAVDTVYLDYEAMDALRCSLPGNMYALLDNHILDYLPQDMVTIKSLAMEALMFQLDVEEDILNIKLPVHAIRASGVFERCISRRVFNTFRNVVEFHLVHEMSKVRNVTLRRGILYGANVNDQQQRSAVLKDVKDVRRQWSTTREFELSFLAAMRSLRSMSNASSWPDDNRAVELAEAKKEPLVLVIHSLEKYI